VQAYCYSNEEVKPCKLCRLGIQNGFYAQACACFRMSELCKVESACQTTILLSVFRRVMRGADGGRRGLQAMIINKAAHLPSSSHHPPSFCTEAPQHEAAATYV
jgi:hypothetical protein